jgi:hypothetical protein
MKKRMIAALAGLMVLALGSMTVLASPSSETPEEKESVKRDAAAVATASVASKGENDPFAGLSVVVDTSGEAPSAIETEGATIIISAVQVDSSLEGMSATEIIAEAEKQAKAEAEGKVATLLGNLAERQTVRTEKLAAFSISTSKLSESQQKALDDGTADIDLTFNVSGVTADGRYVVMHYCSKHSSWESVPIVSYGNGTITLNFHSFSPVVITKVYAVDDENLGEGAGEGNGSTLTAGVTSPKTGETVPFAAVLSVVLFAGAAVCAAKRVKFN